MRQRQLRHTFLAHDAPVKSIVVDENEEFFISGSEDGDIKVATSLIIHSFPAPFNSTQTLNIQTELPLFPADRDITDVFGRLQSD